MRQPSDIPIALVGIILGALAGFGTGMAASAEPPAEAVPRPAPPRFIFSHPVCQVEGKTVEMTRTWLVYDSVTRVEYLVIDGACVTPLLAR